MILLDTSYFLAVMNPRDSLHSRAEAWTQILSEPLLVTEYVVLEAVNALSMPVDRPKARAIVARVRSGLGFEFVPTSPELLQVGLKLHFDRPDKEWSLTDCVSFLVMRHRGITQSLTYDHHFEQAGFDALLRRDPP